VFVLSFIEWSFEKAAGLAMDSHLDEVGRMSGCFVTRSFGHRPDPRFESAQHVPVSDICQHRLH
jgi:hypothetical protein